MTVPPLTVAAVLLEENQLTPLSAVSLPVLPTVNSSEVGAICVEVPLLMVTVQLPAPPFSEALMVAEPAFFAVTTPFWSTVATDVSELLQTGSSAPVWVRAY